MLNGHRLSRPVVLQTEPLADGRRPTAISAKVFPLISMRRHFSCRRYRCRGMEIYAAGRIPARVNEGFSMGITAARCFPICPQEVLEHQKRKHDRMEAKKAAERAKREKEAKAAAAAKAEEEAHGSAGKLPPTPQKCRSSGWILELVVVLNIACSLSAPSEPGRCF